MNIQGKQIWVISLKFFQNLLHLIWLEKRALTNSPHSRMAYSEKLYQDYILVDEELL
jgi:hypothetical protein